MKTIGLLGGMSWESSIEYYRIINEEVNQRLGKSHSAKCVLYSFDFQEIEDLQNAGKWEALAGALASKAQGLKDTGADFIVICTNTMHLLSGEIEEATGLKVLHVAAVTGAEIKSRGLKKVALLGTNFTMESGFYRDILARGYGIDVVIPSTEDRRVIHDIIYKELVVGRIKDSSREKYVGIIDGLAAAGAQGVILGCTEIPLLIKQADVTLPVFDTTEIHAKAAVGYALSMLPG